MERVLEDGPWLIRTVPLILNVWSPNTDLKKAEVKKAPVWIKLHHVPIVAYSEIGLSLITTQIGKPITLDSYTSNMCVSSWGKSTYARALTEVSAENKLLDVLVIAIPIEKDKGHMLATIDIEYEWNPPRCATCLIFNHHTDKCPKLPKTTFVKNVNGDGFVEVKKKKHKNKNRQHKVAGIRLSKPQPQLHYRRVEKDDSSKKVHSDTPQILEISVSNSFGILDDDNGEEDSSLKNEDVLNFSDNDIDEEIHVGRGDKAEWDHYISGFHMYRVVKKLKNLKKPFRKLLYEKGDLHANVNRLHNDLDAIQTSLDTDPFNVALREKKANYIVEFNNAVLMEERFLKQKEKIQWLKEGDSNSAYFHKAVKSRVSRSRIDVITNSEVALDMVRDVSDQEVKIAIFLWVMTKHRVRTGLLQRSLKKLGIKIIANHIKHGLKTIISPNQSAFVLGRSITDNILLTQELMHNYHLDRGSP
nr:hypothetical protein [Tanacetum cinerariifolium]